MAEIELFHYNPEDSLLRRTDARVKLPLLLISTIVLYKVHPRGLLFLSALIILLFILTRPFLQHLFYELKGAALLTVLIFSAVSLSTGNIFQAVLASWRFIMTILLGIILISTTHPEEIETAVYWYLKPFPFISASKTATRIRLTITFIPVLLDTVNEIKEARLSRCIQREKNPVKKIYTLTIPLFNSIINKAEKTSFAMESRCYSDNKTYQTEKFALKNIFQLSAGVIGVLLSLFL